jgi:hypothetical protein
MSLPTVIVEVENNEVSDTHVLGSNDVHVVVIDWDHIDQDAEEAKGLLEEMDDLPANEVTDPIFSRLKTIIADCEDKDEEIDDDIEDEEEYCDECGEPGCYGGCCDDDNEDDFDL